MEEEDQRHVTGCRLRMVRREDLPEAAQAIFDQAQDPGSKSLRGLRGPSGISLHSPELAVLNRPVTRFLRFESGISARTREVAILVTARINGSHFEWAAHEQEALNVGVPAATIEIIRAQEDPGELSPTDALVIRLGRAIFVERIVDDELYAQLVDEFGTTGLINIVALMGNYAATAALLCTFDMQLDEGVPAPF
jgi:4-carboxymuconolactone decarboxylase